MHFDIRKFRCILNNNRQVIFIALRLFYLITELKDDTTQILPCRKGDIFGWVQFSGQLLPGHVEYRIADLWVMNDGDQVLITNRLEDLPEWVPIFPTTVTGRNTVLMKKKIEEGFYPCSQLELNNLPNAWKLKEGHYLIWLGESRPDHVSENRILKIFRPILGTLVLHQPRNQEDLLLQNGIVINNQKRYLDDNASNTMNLAMGEIKSKGIPRTYTPVWKLG